MSKRPSRNSSCKFAVRSIYVVAGYGQATVCSIVLQLVQQEGHAGIAYTEHKAGERRRRDGGRRRRIGKKRKRKGDGRIYVGIERRR
jgi:hypothetical protein